MRLKLTLLLVVFAFVGAEEKCGEEKAVACVVKLISNILEETTDEQDCATLAEASSCLAEANEDCIGEERNEYIEEGRQIFKMLTAMNCNRKDVSDEAEKCVNGLESELMSCIDEGVAEVLELLMDLPEGTKIEEDAIECGMYKSITKCIVTKIENQCGEEAGLAALAEMMDDDEILDSCKQATLGGANLKDYMIQMAKKKRK